jgi:hypothetical protein
MQQRDEPNARRHRAPGVLTPQPPDQSTQTEIDAERRRRRARFLAELTEAKQLRERVAPRRTRAARLRAELRRRSYLI